MITDRKPIDQILGGAPEEESVVPNRKSIDQILTETTSRPKPPDRIGKLFTDTMGLSERGMKSLGRIFTPKKLEKQFGFEKPTETAADKLFKGGQDFNTGRLAETYKEQDTLKEAKAGYTEGAERARENIEKRKEVTEPIAESMSFAPRQAYKAGVGIINMFDRVSQRLGGALEPLITPALEETINNLNPTAKEDLMEGLADLTEYYEALPENEQEALKMTGLLTEAVTSLIGTPIATKAVSKTGEKILDTGKAVIKDIKEVPGLAKETTEIAGNVPVKEMASEAKQAITPDLTPSPKTAQTLTNIDKAVYERIQEPMYAKKVDQHIKDLDEGVDPNLNLTTQVAENIKRVDSEAGKVFGEQARAFTDSGVKVGVSSKLGEVKKAVDEFAPGNDLKFIQTRTPDGKLSDWKLEAGQYSPFNEKEIRYVNRMIDDIRSAKSITPDEVLALDKKLSQYYGLVDDSNGARPYHALVMKVKDTTEKLIADSLPKELKDAYENFARVQRMKRDIGGKFVDAKGNIKDSAMSFFSNIQGKNKDLVGLKAKEYEDLLGIDLVKEAEAVADARKLALENAPTGGRVSDLIKSYGAFAGGGLAEALLPGTGLGFAGGAVASGMVTKALTSPRVVAAKMIKKVLESRSKDLLDIMKMPKSEQGKAINKLLKDFEMEPKQSYASGLKERLDENAMKGGDIEVKGYTNVDDFNKAGAAKSADPTKFKELAMKAQTPDNSLTDYPIEELSKFTLKTFADKAGYALKPVDDKGRMELVNVFVIPEAQGQGLGAKAITDALETASKSGAKTVYLDAYKRLEKLYSKFGFKTIETLKFDPKIAGFPEGEDLVLMEINLK